MVLYIYVAIKPSNQTYMINCGWSITVYLIICVGFFGVNTYIIWAYWISIFNNKIIKINIVNIIHRSVLVSLYF